MGCERDNVMRLLQLNSIHPAVVAISFSTETPSGAIDGSNTAFAVANSPISGSFMLFLNGIKQREGGANDFTRSGTSITYNTAPLAGDTLEAVYAY
jgi:hypothetical protein